MSWGRDGWVVPDVRGCGRQTDGGVGLHWQGRKKQQQHWGYEPKEQKGRRRSTAHHQWRLSAMAIEWVPNPVYRIVNSGMMDLSYRYDLVISGHLLSSHSGHAWSSLGAVISIVISCRTGIVQGVTKVRGRNRGSDRCGPIAHYI